MALPEPFAGLIEEHVRIAEAVATARAATEAAAQYGEPPLVEAMVEALRELRRFMDRELALHIAREELVVFPAFRALTHDDRLIDELIEQHDRVRDRRVLLERVLTALDQHHDDVEVEHARLGSTLDALPAEVTPDVVTALLEGVRQLDWILQGHFGDEEDDLFTPGATLFEAADLERLAREVDAIDESSPG